MRRPSLVAAVLVPLALAAPAAAKDVSIQATDLDTWSPAHITIAPGDSVTFSNPMMGFHQAMWNSGTFDTGKGAEPSQPGPWPSTYTRTLTTPGTYHFYCTVHGSPSGFGMSGVVTVQSGSSPPPPPPPPPDTKPPKITKAHAGYSRRVPFVSFHLSEKARVTAQLARKAHGKTHKIAFFDKKLGAGQRKATFGKRTLAAGSYVVTVNARDATGNKAKTIQAPFRVK